MLFLKKKPVREIFVFNTKGREKQVFKPIKKAHIKMYSCGPTVYDFVHVGNLRSFVLSDIVRRSFEYAGYKVTQVINITDFGHLVGDADDTEDKMLLALKREGKEISMENMRGIALQYENAFKEDMMAMNIKTPNVMPRASEHVQGMIAYIETLLHKDMAYATSDGVYFNTEKFPEYGALGGSASEMHSRTGVSSEKKNPRDFALWKFNTEMGWDAPWGKGFPGWHIECTAMSTRYLGKTFDIHTGGIDHIAVHHNNEIAQAESANNKPYATYWFHNEFVTIDARRIGKSEGNSITLRQLIDRGISPLAYRYWLLTGHYRQTINFTWEAIQAAHTAWHRAQRIFADLKGNGLVHEGYAKKFESAIFDDFNTPGAIAVLWELLKDDSVADGVKRKTILSFDAVLGLGFARSLGPEIQSKLLVGTEVSDDVQRLLEARSLARAEKDFARADSLRGQIAQAGYSIEDGPDGPVLKKTTGVG